MGRRAFARENSTLTRRCVDYERILQAMALIYNYSRGDAVRMTRVPRPGKGRPPRREQLCDMER